MALAAARRRRRDERPPLSRPTPESVQQLRAGTTEASSALLLLPNATRGRLTSGPELPKFYARVLAWLEVNVLDTQPRYLGPKIPIDGRASATYDDQTIEPGERPRK